MAGAVVTNFIAASDASLEALRSANLLKSLSINALITGEKGTGKLTLAQYIVPNAPVVDGPNLEELEDILSSNNTVIIKNFEKIPNHNKLNELIKKYNNRIIATTAIVLQTDVKDRFFSIVIPLKSLEERQEDIPLLVEMFLKEAKYVLGSQNDINIDLKSVDISANAHSLRRSIFLRYLVETISGNEIMQIMQNFLETNLGGNSDYRNFLHLYEAPLINAGMKKFKSQLQLANRLGLNRNTLRKKISENKDYLEF